MGRGGVEAALGAGLQREAAGQRHARSRIKAGRHGAGPRHASLSPSTLSLSPSLSARVRVCGGGMTVG